MQIKKMQITKKNCKIETKKLTNKIMNKEKLKNVSNEKK